jgi:opacity protein-like surface antigen
LFRPLEIRFQEEAITLHRAESLLRPSIFISLISLLAFSATIAAGQSTSEAPSFARRNSFGIFTAYSADSSHILLGSASNRRLLDFGVSYNRRLFMNRYVSWQYSGELLPVALESDPVVHQTVNETSPSVVSYSSSYTQAAVCVARTTSFNDTFVTTSGTITYAGTVDQTCGRKWTIGETMSPIGFQWNFRLHNKIQPFLIGHGGSMYSTQPIPVTGAGSFNFTFDLGAGLEIFHDRHRSLRAEYRYHHISNHDTASQNPGIDNGLLQLTYAFGR